MMMFLRMYTFKFLLTFAFYPSTRQIDQENMRECNVLSNHEPYSTNDSYVMHQLDTKQHLPLDVLSYIVLNNPQNHPMLLAVDDLLHNYILSYLVI